MQKSFDAYNDPGHGWVKVPKSLLKELGIAEKITNCSYMRKDFAYLEEDHDATILIDALKARGITPKWRDHTSNKNSKIENYEPYKAPVYRDANKPGEEEAGPLDNLVCGRCGKPATSIGKKGLVCRSHEQTDEYTRNLANAALENMLKGPGIVSEATECSRPWP